MDALAFGGLLWACCWGCVKDELHNTPYPDLGTVMVAADWSGRSSDAAVPGTWSCTWMAWTARGRGGEGGGDVRVARSGEA